MQSEASILFEISEDAAHGGKDWSPRTDSLRQEINRIWGNCGLSTEWTSLRAVLLHRPGAELETVTDANKSLMRAVPDKILAGRQHDDLAEVYRGAGISVFYVEPSETPTPNLMFVADLMLMTPEGAVLARPASNVRAGEEKFVARRLAELGIPILRCVRGNGVFEGADACWIDPDAMILATGLRTNAEGAAQVANLLKEMGVEVVRVGLPFGAMHLMGTLRFVDKDLAICWKSRVPYAAVEALRERGFSVLSLPDEEEAVRSMALNFVTLGPRQIVMPAGNPKTQSFYDDLGIKCVTVEVDELHKAAGGIGCLSGILRRELDT